MKFTNKFSEAITISMLFLNGKSLGKKCKQPLSDKSIERFRLMWNDVVYEPGELKAVAYREGERIGEQIMKTAGNPYRIKLSPDRTIIHADGIDLSYVLIEAFDKAGLPCPLADNRIDIKIEGPATIAGVGNGNPQSFEPFQANYVKLFYGKAMLIVRSGTDKGEVKITASASGLRTGKATLKIE